MLLKASVLSSLSAPVFKLQGWETSISRVWVMWKISSAVQWWGQGTELLKVPPSGQERVKGAFFSFLFCLGFLFVSAFSVNTCSVDSAVPSYLCGHAMYALTYVWSQCGGMQHIYIIYVYQRQSMITVWIIKGPMSTSSQTLLPLERVEADLVL